ncbi:hypothetical protein [Nannocystis sp. SCPEA4]|uniref:hypothetical protein n=1 Tax=Nannocystis sp. SCPEA4 TaxID=2996787 RepID=UPI00226EED90|nr:hypothetical protein [Nannocystis sp. SCPEA4]MCY1061557.1 hypothetical protein [Nannocystis sp. SCPEA4]
MSIDALVFTRTKPELDVGEHDVVNIEFVQLVAPCRVQAEHWRRIGREPDASLGWVTDVNCSNSAYQELAAFARALARRCGGGLFWCDLTATTREIAGDPADRPRDGRPLHRVLETAQLEIEDDESDWEDPVEEAPAPTPRLPHTEQWDVGVAQFGDAEAWVRPGLTAMFFVLLAGQRVAVEEMRRSLARTIDSALLTGAIGLEYSSESPARWIERVHRPGASMSCVRATANGDLSVAHAGDARAYRIFARKAEPVRAAGTKLLLGSTIVLCSSEVWRALGDDIDEVFVEVVEAHRRLGAQAAARALLQRASDATTAVVVVAHHRSPTRAR